jgi:hypothetical protein
MDTKVQLNVWVAPEDRAFLKARAAERGVSVSELIRRGVDALRPAKVDETAAAINALDAAVTGLDRSMVDLQELCEGLDRRLSRLEEMANV